MNPFPQPTSSTREFCGTMTGDFQRHIISAAHLASSPFAPPATLNSCREVDGNLAEYFGQSPLSERRPDTLSKVARLILKSAPCCVLCNLDARQKQLESQEKSRRRVFMARDFRDE